MVTVRSPSTVAVAVGLAVALGVVAVTVAAGGAADSQVAIEEDTVEQARGDVAEFTLSVPRGESVTLVLDGADGDRHRLNLTDRIADGRIGLSINTYRAGSGANASDVFAVDGRDALSVVGNDTGALPDDSYRVAAYANDTDGDPADAADLRLTDPGLANATVMVAPGDAVDRIDSRAAVERGRAEGWLTRTDRVAETDALVLRLTAPGIAGAVADEPGISDETRFRAFLDRPNTSVRVAIKHPTPMRARQYSHLNGSTADAVVADPERDTYYVVARLAGVPHSYGLEGKRRTDEPNYYENEMVPQLVVDGERRLNPGDIGEPNRTAEFHVTWPEATLSHSEDARLTPGFAAEPNQTVTGYTTVAPGTAVTVSVTDATGIETPRNATAVVTRETAEIGNYGSRRRVFRASLNLSGVEPGTEVDLALAPTDPDFPGEHRFDEHRAPVDSPRASVESADDPVANGTVRVASATLPDGGFVAVERAADGTVVGSTEYLDAGAHEGLRVPVSEGATAGDSRLRVYLAHDSDGDGTYFASADRSYADSMRAVGATVPRTGSTTDSPPTGTATATPTPFQPSVTTGSPTATPSDPTAPPPSTATVHVDTGVTPTPPSTTDTSRPDGTGGATAADGPGFGALAALAGLVGAVLLVARRGSRR
ncbi:DUF7282 domain-containing protein [Halosimplex marinum]|uniref:DUF7282 domain-containing protein n=1 Tax=Halosimplex marinum TaxID=3396620 RepID=UPI003F551B4F